jgi:tetratricopeptide (TPR) repeat protein
MLMPRLLIFLFLIIVPPAFASPVDSLENLLKTAQGADKVKVMNELFRAYITSDPVKAVEYTRAALALAEKVADEKGQAACYNNLGVAYRNQGALDVALANYMKSLDIYTKLQHADGISTTKNNIATIYSMKKNYAQALTYFEQSHQGFVALGSTDKVIGSMNNLGNLHSDLQMYDKAITYFTDAYAMAQKSGTEYADPLTNIGNLYYRQGNFQRAAEYYERAMVIVRKQNDRAGELSILANMGELFEKAAQPDKAQKYLEEALNLAAELDAHYIVPQILKSMAANLARQNKMKEAYETLLKYDGAKEKIFGEESSRRIAQMDVAMDLKAKEEEIQTLHLSDQNKSLKLRNAQIIIVAGVMTIITGIAVFNLMFSRRKKKKVA